MKKTVNLCVNCDARCNHCGLDRATMWYCDRCREENEPDELYDYDGEELCARCLLKQFKTVAER